MTKKEYPSYVVFGPLALWSMIQISLTKTKIGLNRQVTRLHLKCYLCVRFGPNGNGAQRRNQPVRARHRHEDFQYLDYPLSIALKTSKILYP